MSNSNDSQTAPVLLRSGITACPFCGHAGVKGTELIRNPTGKANKVYSAICDNDDCNAHIPGDTFEQARMKWNARE